MSCGIMFEDIKEQQQKNGLNYIVGGNDGNNEKGQVSFINVDAEHFISRLRSRK